MKPRKTPWYGAALLTMIVLGADLALANTGGSQVGGGGEVVRRGGENRVRDIEEGLPHCRMVPWNQFSRNFPDFDQHLESLRSAHFEIALNVEEELQKMRFCFTNQTLPVVPGPDSPVVRGRRTVAWRRYNRVYVHEGLFRGIRDFKHRFILVVHEASHRYFPRDSGLSDEERFSRLRLLAGNLFSAMEGHLSPEELGEELRDLRVPVHPVSPMPARGTPDWQALRTLLSGHSTEEELTQAALGIFIRNHRQGIRPPHPLAAYGRRIHASAGRAYIQWQRLWVSLDSADASVFDRAIDRFAQLASWGIPVNFGRCEDHPDLRALDVPEVESELHIRCREGDAFRLYEKGDTILHTVARTWRDPGETRRRIARVLSLPEIDPNRLASGIVFHYRPSYRVELSECFSALMRAAMYLNTEAVQALLEDARVDPRQEFSSTCREGHLALWRNLPDRVTALTFVTNDEYNESIARNFLRYSAGWSWLRREEIERRRAEIERLLLGQRR